ncbi:hypothetical protein [Actinomadura sp. 21ATH]|uniref:hypothetical protein n=1 Tax=Actinomadura sp. 21ATH TaxID=1735444 RepID=UPI0035BF5D1B
MSNALFDLPDLPQLKHAPPPPEDLSPDRRRTIRQADTLAAGNHPIGLILRRRVQLHEDAAPATDRKAEGLRCGGCRFREIASRPIRSYGKCTRAGSSYSAASDNRAWWPACVHFEPKDGTE